jgi:hypothetical protein
MVRLAGCRVHWDARCCVIPATVYQAAMPLGGCGVAWGGGAGDGATGHVFFRTTQYKKRLTGCEGLDGVPEIDGLHGCLRIG